MIGAITFSTFCALGIIFISYWLYDFWILLGLIGVFLAFYWHSAAPNMICGGLIIIFSIITGVTGIFFSAPLAFVSISYFFIYFINSALTGVKALEKNKHDRNAQQGDQANGV
jgi:4-hydroxybenzoate polyprenyltransferase